MKHMYLNDVEVDTLPGDHGNMIRQMRAAGLPVPQIQYLFAFKSEGTSHLAHFTQAVMRGPSPLSPAQRELIAALTSQLNACPF